MAASTAPQSGCPADHARDPDRQDLCQRPKHNTATSILAISAGPESWPCSEECCAKAAQALLATIQDVVV